jgi:hypothetical protein
MNMTDLLSSVLIAADLPGFETEAAEAGPKCSATHRVSSLPIGIFCPLRFSLFLCRALVVILAAGSRIVLHRLRKGV